MTSTPTGSYGQSQPRGRGCANDEASFKAEVIEARTPGHNRSERNKRQRRRSRQRVAKSAQRCKRFVKKNKIGLQRVGAKGDKKERRNQHCGQKRSNCATDDCER